MASVKGKSILAQQEAQAYAAKQAIREASKQSAGKARKSFSFTNYEDELDVALPGGKKFGRG